MNSSDTERSGSAEPELRDRLTDTWAIHARILLYFLAGVEPAALSSESGLKGRPIGSQFAHLHNVRLMWLKAAAPDLLSGLEKFENATPSASMLTAALAASGRAIGDLLGRGLQSGKIKGFKPHPVAFLGYLVAHESFHEGHIGVRLTESGFPLAQKVAYGIWEWGSR